MSKAKKRAGSADYEGFLWRNVSEIRPTLNAISAISRIGNIQDEYQQLKSVIENSEISSFRISILKYYLVSMVTCLEWHAKSRLSDFLSYCPDRLSSDDLASLKLDEALPLARSFTTIAALVAQMKSINGVYSYASVFQRIFDKFGYKTSAQKIIDKFAFSGETGKNEIEDLFLQRHVLVHEISIMQVGPYTFRDPFDFAEAEKTIGLIFNLVTHIEKIISEITPDDFPNKIMNKTQIELIEGMIQTEAKGITDKLSKFEFEFSEWNQLWNFIDDSYRREVDLVYEFEAIRPVRHIDYRHVIIDKLGRFRLEYLKYLHEIIENLI